MRSLVWASWSPLQLRRPTTLMSAAKRIHGIMRPRIDGAGCPFIFNTAWLIEKDLAEFYARMSEQTSGKVSKKLGVCFPSGKSNMKNSSKNIATNFQRSIPKCLGVVDQTGCPKQAPEFIPKPSGLSSA